MNYVTPADSVIHATVVPGCPNSRLTYATPEERKISFSMPVRCVLLHPSGSLCLVCARVLSMHFLKFTIRTEVQTNGYFLSLRATP